MFDYGNIFGFVGSRRSATILKLDEIIDFGEKHDISEIFDFLEPSLCEKCWIMAISLVLLDQGVVRQY